ncbi:hypothetical protein, partial [Thermus scotoductus]|uniref:hypothetical protein n=1 Tax=Thermus scotoductus TaxID=37636 RepID=UPI001C12B9F2
YRKVGDGVRVVCECRWSGEWCVRDERSWKLLLCVSGGYCLVFFFFKQMKAYDILEGFVGAEMFISEPGRGGF